MTEPGFLAALIDEADSLGGVRRVDRKLVLEVMLLLLTHFVGNLIVDHRGNPMRVACNTMLVGRRRSCPLWLTGILKYLHARKREEQDADSVLGGLSCSGFMQQEPEDDDVVQMMLRRAQPAPFPLPEFIEHGFPVFSTPMGKYLMTSGDGPCMGPGMRDGAVLLVEGSEHLKELCDAQEQYQALWTSLNDKAKPMVSVFGWHKRSAGILGLQFPGSPLLLGVPYGGGMTMNVTLEHDGVRRHRNIFYDEGRNLQAFTMLLNHLLGMRESHQVMSFEPNTRCRELLMRVADDEHRDVMEFSAEHRMLAAPVMGLGLSLTTLFWLLAYKPRVPMETLMLTTMAIDIARQIRRRSLTWLRRELAASCCQQMDSMDVKVLQKLRQAGCALRPRQLQRTFDHLRSRDLREVLLRLQAQGLVQEHAGRVTAVCGQGVSESHCARKPPGAWSGWA